MTRILFIDDEPDTLATLKKAVELFGHQALLASSGEEGLRQAEQYLPNLILVDCRLPDMDGYRVIAQLRQAASTAKIPVFMLSAGPESESAALALAAGAQDYLLKPIRLQALLDLLARFGKETADKPR